MNENEIKCTDNLTDNKELRERYISRVEVLDKVKKLMMIPSMELMTIKQVAEYYEVDIEVIRRQYKNNREEFELDGARKYSISEARNCIGTFNPNTKIVYGKGKIEVEFENGMCVTFLNVGIILFPKRAVLRMGMLLRDSIIAQEVRTQLLNMAEHITEENPEILTREIDKEGELLLDIAKAYASGDPIMLMKATSAHASYLKRHNDQLTKENEELGESNKKLAESNDILAGDILEWSDRKSANSVVRLMAKEMHQSYSSVWGFIYKELLYKHGINLKQRDNRKAPYIAHLRENEWECFYKSAAAIMQMNNIEPSEIFAKISKERVKVGD